MRSITQIILENRFTYGDFCVKLPGSFECPAGYASRGPAGQTSFIRPHVLHMQRCETSAMRLRRSKLVRSSTVNVKVHRRIRGSLLSIVFLSSAAAAFSNA